MADLGRFNSGDQLQLRFRGGWDWGTTYVPGWIVDNVEVSYTKAELIAAGSATGSGLGGADVKLLSGTLTIQGEEVPELGGVTAGLQVWYDASTLSLNDGEQVTAWADRSGNGRDLVSWTGTPTFETNEINGLPAVRFDADNENLQLANPANTYFAADVFLVFRSGNGANFGPDWGAPIGVKDGDDNDRMWMFQPGEDRFWDQELPSAVRRNGSAVSSANNFDMGGIDASQYMVLQVTAGPNNGTQTREYIVGTRTDAWANSRFDTAEVIVYDHVLSDTERLAVEAYLTDKYVGLAAAFGNDATVSGSSTIQLGTGIRVASLGSLTVAADTALNVVSTATADQELAFSDTTTLAGAATVNLTGGATLTLSDVAGAADLTQAGGTVRLSSVNTDFDAGNQIAVSHGTLVAGVSETASALGDADVSVYGGHVGVRDGGGLDYRGGDPQRPAPLRLQPLPGRSGHDEPAQQRPGQHDERRRAVHASELDRRVPADGRPRRPRAELRRRRRFQERRQVSRTTSTATSGWGPCTWLRLTPGTGNSATPTGTTGPASGSTSTATAFSIPTAI